MDRQERLQLTNQGPPYVAWYHHAGPLFGLGLGRRDGGKGRQDLAEKQKAREGKERTRGRRGKFLRNARNKGRKKEERSAQQSETV